jgi:hypothetical protein
VQPLSTIVPVLSSRQRMHIDAAVPSHTPPAHMTPAPIGVFAQSPVVQASVVQPFPSLQCAGIVHSTHVGVPESSQTGLVDVHPVSSSTPAASSRHGTQSGSVDAPSHTPPAHGVPAMRGEFPHDPLPHVSVVQEFPSLQ